MKNDTPISLAGPERHLAWFGFSGLDQMQIDRFCLIFITVALVIHFLLLLTGCVGIEPLMTDH